MKTIIFIGTQQSGSSREALKAAKELGFYVVLFTNRRQALLKSDKFSEVNRIIQANLNDFEELKNRTNELIKYGLTVSAVISFTDGSCHMASRLSDALGLHGFTTAAVMKMENKELSRACLKDSGYAPRYLILENDKSYSSEDVKNFLPGVIKSACSTGSKAVFKVNSCEEMTVRRALLQTKNPQANIILEEYLDGPQYLVETLVYGQSVHISAIVEQEISFLNNHFIVTGYSLLVRPPEGFYRKIEKAVTEIIRLHGLENGSCHLEMRLVKDGWKLVEINPRMAGAGMNRLIYFGCGINFASSVLKLAAYGKPDFNPRFWHYINIQYYTADEAGIVKEISGVEKAKAAYGVLEVSVKAKRGHKIIPPESMGNRYAYVIAGGTSKAAAQTAAKAALKNIQFILKKQ